MFCSSNDTFQNITEKTKLIAQKCSQQIRVTAANTTNQQTFTHPNFTNSAILNVASLKENAKSGLRSLCACKGTLKVGTTKRSPVKERSSTRWYVKQPTWRIWGEEREPDAIFTVYLKKVRYHRPTPSASSQDSDDERSHLEWETIKVRFVKGAQLTRLVDSLITDDGELESTFVNVFLATYRTFAKPYEVLDLLIKKHEDLSNNLNTDEIALTHQKTLVSALHIWLDGYPEDWNAENLQRLLGFTSRRLPNSELHLKALRLNDRLALSHQEPLTWIQEINDMPSVFRNTNFHVLEAYRFPNIDVQLFAQQLTRMDVELFKRLIPHQCLGATWGRRDKHEADTVVATVNQFNAVLHRVISSILIEYGLTPPKRAVYISVWIDIAQQLRILKNFSSLKAIIAGLQANAIYRLKKTWDAVPRDKYGVFKDLAEVFSEDNNASRQRQVLMNEGTAKTANLGGDNDRHLHKVLKNQNQLTNVGTIPFLGIFLTDLTMIHTMYPDFLDNGMINFDKRRKEFETLAQIKLLQGAANAYSFPQDPLFDRWFASALILDEKRQNELSCTLEPPIDTKNNNGHKKTDSITSTSSGAGSQFNCDMNSTFSSRNNSLDRDVTPPNASILSRTSSFSSLSLESSISGDKKSINSIGNNKITRNSTGNNGSVPQINLQLLPSHSSPNVLIIKVTSETDNMEKDGIVLYKCMMLSNNERTPIVIRNAMMKLCLDGDPENFTLSQVLPDKELVMPPNANVFYAVNTQHNLNFILRPKKE